MVTGAPVSGGEVVGAGDTMRLCSGGRVPGADVLGGRVVSEGGRAVRYRAGARVGMGVVGDTVGERVGEGDGEDVGALRVCAAFFVRACACARAHRASARARVGCVRSGWLGRSARRSRCGTCSWRRGWRCRGDLDKELHLGTGGVGLVPRHENMKSTGRLLRPRWSFSTTRVGRSNGPARVERCRRAA